VSAPAGPYLLGGPRATDGPEPYASHRERFGDRPEGGQWMLTELRASGLQGRGGARFPAAIKWEAVRERGRGHAAVVINAAEGEPLSDKDGVLLWNRLHAVFDGALLAAETVGAREIVLYARADYAASLRESGALARAVAERPRAERLGERLTVHAVPHAYIAGEETAAISVLNGGRAVPAFAPPRPFERGLGGRPTLVQDAETLAWAALIARYGAPWFRAEGVPGSPGPGLFTVSGAVARRGVFELRHGAPLEQLAQLAGGTAAGSPGVLTGGYFGGWVRGDTAPEAGLDDSGLAALGGRVGCGVVHVLPPGTCPVSATSAVLSWLAKQSARQCGPCEFGLSALAAAVQRIASGSAILADHVSVERWIPQLAAGRGACRLPDGAVAMLASGLEAFRDDFEAHRARRGCGLAPAVLPAA
jgi:NADH:ubiquinone oxidoreductase subunit F (NADH-binding)